MSSLARRGRAPPRPTGTSRRGCPCAGAGRARSRRRGGWASTPGYPSGSAIRCHGADATVRRSLSPPRVGDRPGRARGGRSVRPRRRAGGLLFCSGQIPLDPRTGELVGGDAGRAGRPLPGEPRRRSAAAAGATLGDAVRMTIYLTDMSAFADGQRGLRVVLRVRSAGARGDRRGGAAARRAGRDRRGGGAARLRRDRASAERRGRSRAPRAGGRAASSRETPVLSSRTLSERAGGTVVLKAENLQRTGSFKLRGALAKLAALGDGCAAAWSPAAPATTRQAVAYAARARGVPCEVFMPRGAPIAKVEAAQRARRRGALSAATGRRVAARRRASAPSEGGLAFVHPFDDPDVIAGQGGLGLELLEQVPDLAPGDRAGRRRRAGQRRGDRAQVRAARGRGDRRAGRRPARRSRRRCAAGDAGGGRLGADDRRRHRGQAPGRADAGADRALGRRDRRRRRGRRRRGDGVPARARQARRRGRRRGRRRRAARRAGVAPRGSGHDGRGALGRQRRRRACSPRSPAATRARPAAGSCCSPACPTARARWRGCSRCVGRAAARTCSTSQHIREGVDLHVRETAVQLVLETRGAEHAARGRGARSASAGYAEPRRRCAGSRGARYGAPLDQRADHAAALVGLGVPLDAEHEPAVGQPRSPRAARRAPSVR